MAKGQGVGARLIRKEDDRLMRGRGQFVADLRFAGMQDVAFVRSPLAHARIRGIAAPQSIKHAVFTAADLLGIKPISPLYWSLCFEMQLYLVFILLLATAHRFRSRNGERRGCDCYHPKIGIIV